MSLQLNSNVWEGLHRWAASSSSNEKSLNLYFMAFETPQDIFTRAAVGYPMFKDCLEELLENNPQTDNILKKVENMSDDDKGVYYLSKDEKCYVKVYLTRNAIRESEVLYQLTYKMEESLKYVQVFRCTIEFPFTENTQSQSYTFIKKTSFMCLGKESLLYRLQSSLEKDFSFTKEEAKNIISNHKDSLLTERETCLYFFDDFKIPPKITCDKLIRDIINLRIFKESFIKGKTM